MSAPNAPENRPLTLMFHGKNIKAVAIGDGVKFGQGKDKEDGTPGNVMIGIPFRIVANQKATLYAKPDSREFDDIDFDDTFLLPEGYTITYMRALTEGTMKYVIEALRTAGWRGSSLDALRAGKAEGLGDNEVKLTVNVKETDQYENFLTDPETGDFKPQMEVAFVNAAGFAFKNAADANAVKSLDQRFADQIKGSAPSRSTQPASKPASRPQPSNNGMNTGGEPPPPDFGPPPGSDDDIPF